MLFKKKTDFLTSFNMYAVYELLKFLWSPDYRVNLFQREFLILMAWHDAEKRRKFLRNNMNNRFRIKDDKWKKERFQFKLRNDVDFQKGDETLKEEFFEF